MNIAFMNVASWRGDISRRRYVSRHDPWAYCSGEGRGELDLEQSIFLHTPRACRVGWSVVPAGSTRFAIPLPDINRPSTITVHIRSVCSRQKSEPRYPGPQVEGSFGPDVPGRS